VSHEKTRGKTGHAGAVRACAWVFIGHDALSLACDLFQAAWAGGWRGVEAGRRSHQPRVGFFQPWVLRVCAHTSSSTPHSRHLPCTLHWLAAGGGLRQDGAANPGSCEYVFIRPAAHSSQQASTLHAALCVQVVLQPLQILLADNCHLTRATAEVLEEAGFGSLVLRRGSLQGVGRILSPHVWGLAVK